MQFRERTFFWCRCVLTGIGLLAAVAQAQGQPLMYVEAARVFESNSGGSAILIFPVRFEGTQNNPVTVSVTATSASGVFFNGATGGTTCGAGVDFEQFTSGPVTISPNTPNGTLSINVRVCGDNTIEADEHVAVSLINVTGATVTPESGTAIGTIVNDDGPPGIQIRGLSASTLQGVSRTVNFTVSLHHPTASPVRVNFATRDGTARARTTSNLGAYIGKFGTLEIPTNTLSATIPVTITGFGGGTFFMDLSAPVNGTLENASAQCSITIRTLTIGSFDVAPESDRIKAGEVVNFATTWTSPEGQVWRDIETLDFRIRKGNEVGLWAQWEEAGNTFRVCVPSGTDELDCSDPALPGSGAVLSGGAAELVMAETTVVGSGPTGLSVTLNLAVRFNEGASGNYNIELGGTDDAGKSDDLFTATKVHIEKSKNK